MEVALFFPDNKHNHHKRNIFLFIMKVRESSYYQEHVDFSFFYRLVKVHIKTQLTLERVKRNR